MVPPAKQDYNVLRRPAVDRLVYIEFDFSSQEAKAWQWVRQVEAA
jgi:hypothetical protein